MASELACAEGESLAKRQETDALVDAPGAREHLPEDSKPSSGIWNDAEEVAFEVLAGGPVETCTSKVVASGAAVVSHELTLPVQKVKTSRPNNTPQKQQHGQQQGRGDHHRVFDSVPFTPSQGIQQSPGSMHHMGYSPGYFAMYTPVYPPPSPNTIPRYPGEEMPIDFSLSPSHSFRPTPFSSHPIPFAVNHHGVRAWTSSGEGGGSNSVLTGPFGTPESYPGDLDRAMGRDEGKCAGEGQQGQQGQEQMEGQGAQRSAFSPLGSPVSTPTAMMFPQTPFASIGHVNTHDRSKNSRNPFSYDNEPDIMHRSPHNSFQRAKISGFHPMFNNFPPPAVQMSLQPPPPPSTRPSGSGATPTSSRALNRKPSLPRLPSSISYNPSFAEAATPHSAGMAGWYEYNSECAGEDGNAAYGAAAYWGPFEHDLDGYSNPQAPPPPPPRGAMGGAGEGDGSDQSPGAIGQSKVAGAPTMFPHMGILTGGFYGPLFNANFSGAAGLMNYHMLAAMAGLPVHLPPYQQMQAGFVYGGMPPGLMQQRPLPPPPPGRYHASQRHASAGAVGNAIQKPLGDSGDRTGAENSGNREGASAGAAARATSHYSAASSTTPSRGPAGAKPAAGAASSIEPAVAGATKPRRNLLEPKVGPDGMPRLNSRQRRTLRRAKERAIKGLMEAGHLLLEPKSGGAVGGEKSKSQDEGIVGGSSHDDGSDMEEGEKGGALGTSPGCSAEKAGRYLEAAFSVASGSVGPTAASAASAALSKVAAELNSADISELISTLAAKKDEGKVDEILIKDLQIIQTLVGALKPHVAGGVGGAGGGEAAGPHPSSQSLPQQRLARSKAQSQELADSVSSAPAASTATATAGIATAVDAFAAATSTSPVAWSGHCLGTDLVKEYEGDGGALVQTKLHSTHHSRTSSGSNVALVH